MILTSKTLKGQNVNFDHNGNQIPTRRETGRGGGRLPDYVFRYLTPGPQRAPELIGGEMAESRLERRAERSNTAESYKMSVRDRIANWFKTWFSWVMRKK